MAVGAVIGALRANLSLNSAKFEKGLKNARSSLGRMQRDMQRIGKGVAIAGTALVAMGAQAVSAARDVQRLSQVANATPRQLQRWSAATRTVGIDQEKLSDILKDVTDRVGDFIATGGGPMADFFENIAPKVGVTAAQFEKLSGPEALQLYVSSLQKAGVSQQQMTFYLEAMASDATLLLPLLRNNGAEMLRLGDAAEAAGAVMSNEAIANLTKMGETSDRIRDSFVGMRGEVAGALAPAFERLAGLMQRAMGEGGLLRRVMLGIAENADRIAAYVGAAAAAFGAYAGAVTLATLVTKNFKKALIRTGIGALAVGLGEAAYQFIRLREATGSGAEALSMLLDIGKGVVNALVNVFVHLGNRIVGVFKGAALASKELFLGFPDIMRSIAEKAGNALASGIVGSINFVARKINSLIYDANAALAKVPGGEKFMLGYLGEIEFEGFGNKHSGALADAGKKAADAFSKGFNEDVFGKVKIFDVPSISEQWEKIQSILRKSDGTKEAEEALSGLREQIEGIGKIPGAGTGTGAGVSATPADAIDEMSDAANRAKEAMGTLRDGLAGVFSSVLRGADSARNAVSQLLDRLADMAAQNAFKALFNSAFGANHGGLFGQAIGWLFGNTPAFATGGISSGGLAMVGERGPELVNLPGGSRVFSAAETARMSGSDPMRLEVSLSGDLEARVLDAAQAEAVRITRAGLEEYDRSGAPRRMAAYEADPRRRG